MAYHSFLLEPISCHAWNKDRTRKYGWDTPSQNPQGWLEAPTVPAAHPRVGQSWVRAGCVEAAPAMDRCWAADSTCPPASPWSHCQDRAQRRDCQHRVRPGTAAWGGMNGAQGGKRSRMIHGRWHFPATAQGMWERTKRAFSAAGDVPGTGVGWGWMGAECLQPSCPIPLHPSHPILPHPVPCNPLSSHPSPSYPTPSHPIPPAPRDHTLGRGGCWAVGYGRAPPFPIGTVHRSRGSFGAAWGWGVWWDLTMQLGLSGVPLCPTKPGAQEGAGQSPLSQFPLAEPTTHGRALSRLLLPRRDRPVPQQP